MATPSGESPAVARRRLRLALRRAREIIGYTQQQVADEMEWSISKVMRIESGEVTISVNDTRSLLSYLGVTDRDEVNRLIQSARDAKKRAWWDEGRFREQLPLALRQLIQFETEARTIRYFHPMFIPGPLQTPGYVETLLGLYRDTLPADWVDTRIEARLLRRKAFLERTDKPRVMLLLDESVLLRTMGDASMLATQLFDLHSLAIQGRVTVRVIPFTAKIALPALGTFEIHNFAIHDASEQLPEAEESTDDAMLYRESGLLDELADDQATVSRHLTVFTDLWNLAHDEKTSIHMLEKAAQSHAASTPDT
ncbi:helix-turn-helix domain-containing protein [Catenuloplanes indicus]|uniref:Transcriptional regulator with XRE-family HTH domain n=1 Tax=Catenuloplanes indicus TaxID=137267 RepID=A0AAE3VZL1_9ACTN|nr:helix-turn-helix transcriptional regulator [Catenuloplanes indicus]MDQ0366104.1 transcriptional regulator with XRE-family HTH domain [Catenuloplanes indicus]